MVTIKYSAAIAINELGLHQTARSYSSRYRGREMHDAEKHGQDVDLTWVIQ